MPPPTSAEVSAWCRGCGRGGTKVPLAMRSSHVVEEKTACVSQYRRMQPPRRTSKPRFQRHREVGAVGVEGCRENKGPCVRVEDGSGIHRGVGRAVGECGGYVDVWRSLCRARRREAARRGHRGRYWEPWAHFRPMSLSSSDRGSSRRMSE